MKNYTNNLIGTAAVATVLAVGALALTAPTRAFAQAPTTASAKQSAEAELAAAEKSEHVALTLEAKAGQHAKLAELYRARSSGGSKQQITFWSLANRSERLAKAERDAALTARNTAAMHRKLASAE